MSKFLATLLGCAMVAGIFGAILYPWGNSTTSGLQNTVNSRIQNATN